jgi:hypothetical protein
VDVPVHVLFYSVHYNGLLLILSASVIVLMVRFNCLHLCLFHG